MVDDTASLFGFELDFAGTLQCIPMCVRFKLDCCGVKLSLKQWNHFPHAARESLIQLPCATAEENQAYRNRVVAFIGATHDGEVKYLPIPPDPPWNSMAPLPAQVSAWSDRAGVAAPTLAQWQALTALQRFVLLKLTHPDHQNRNFLAALREFGLRA